MELLNFVWVEFRFCEKKLQKTSRNSTSQGFSSFYIMLNKFGGAKLQSFNYQQIISETFNAFLRKFNAKLSIKI